MEVSVRFFALYRDRAGCSVAQVAVPQDSTVAELVSAVRGRFPRLAPPDVNQEFNLAIGVVNAVADSQRGGDQRHYLVAGVGPARRIAPVQALLQQLEKTEVQGQGRWMEQAGIVH